MPNKVGTHSYKGILLCFILAAVVVAGCSTQVRRIDTGSDIDLSGKWNDVDSRMVAEEVTADLLSRPWRVRYTTQLGRLPIILVGGVRNDSSEHINTDAFIKDIEVAMVNSADLEVVADSQQQSLLREERQKQNIYASAQTRKLLANELGADLILLGSINTIEDVAGKRQIRYYQISMELIDIETNRKLWIGQTKIKKDIYKPLVRG